MYALLLTLHVHVFGSNIFFLGGGPRTLVEGGGEKMFASNYYNVNS